MDLSLRKHINNISSHEQPDEKGIFLKRIGSLLEEGYSLKDALLFLKKIEKGAIFCWIQSIEKNIVTGQPFHEELRTIGFSEKICSQIYLASQYGNYGETIKRCGEQLLAEVDKKKKFRSLLSYPMLLVAFLIGMLFLMRFLILPHMETIFITSHSEVNIYSNWLVSIIYYSPQIMFGMFLIIILGYILIKSKLKQLSVLDRYEWIMKYPIINTYLKDYWSHFFFFEWGNLLKNGCSFQEIILIMKGDDASKLLKETGDRLAKEMKGGKSIHESIKSLPFFHDEAILILLHGENTGSLGTEMTLYASFCESEFVNRLEKLMNRIQPIIFIFIALMIIGIYASLMLPIFSLMEGF